MFTTCLQRENASRDFLGAVEDAHCFSIQASYDSCLNRFVEVFLVRLTKLQTTIILSLVVSSSLGRVNWKYAQKRQKTPQSRPQHTAERPCEKEQEEEET